MNRYLVILIRALLVCMWTPVAAGAVVAAAQAGSEPMLAVPLALLMATAFVSTLAGATTLCLRMVAELKAIAESDKPERPLVKPWLYCLAHMLGSWTAGLFFFLVSMHQQATPWTLLGTVLLASFAGSKALEVAADRFLPTVKP